MAYTTKEELAYQTLKQRILSGTYAPGERIPVMRIARELSVSVIPVREALHRLEAEGLLCSHPHVGVVVSMPSLQEVRDVLELLAELEGLAAREGYPYLTEGDIERVEQLLDEMTTAEGDHSRYAELNREFHAVLYEACPNRYLKDVIKDLLARYDRLWPGEVKRKILFGDPESRAESLGDHRRIVAALRAGSGELLGELIVEHKLRSARRLVQHLEKQSSARIER